MGAKRTTTRVLNIIQKIADPVIHLKVDGEQQRKATKRCKGQMTKGRTSEEASKLREVSRAA